LLSKSPGEFFYRLSELWVRVRFGFAGKRELKMPTNDRSIPFLLTVYAGVLGAIALGAGYAYSSITFETEQGAVQSPRGKTVLDERIASAREIKDALRRPIPGLEPLSPVTAKLAHPPSSKVASVPQKKIKLPISPAARNAMAMEQGGASPAGSYSAPDRAGPGGW